VGELDCKGDFISFLKDLGANVARRRTGGCDFILDRSNNLYIN
jgi:hypothetical protein